MIKVSNKILKNAKALGQNILVRLHKVSDNDQTLASYLERYAKQNLTLLQEALKLTYTLTGKNDQLSLFDIAGTHAFSDENPAVALAAAAALSELLKYAEHPTHHAEIALTVIYDMLWEKFLNKARVKKTFYDRLILPFLDYPYYWETVSSAGNTLAHFAAQHGDIALLEKALQKHPEFLEKQNTNLKETVLYTATRYRHDKMAALLINKYHANINATNGANLNVLANCVYFNSPKTVKLLLDKGCSINAATNLIIPPDSLHLVKPLLEGGFFIPSGHKAGDNATHIIRTFGKTIDFISKPLIILNDKNDADTYELISGADELEACTITPSESQIERLRLSIEETLLYENTDALTEFYKTFLKKFSIQECITHEQEISPVILKKYTLNEFNFSNILLGGKQHAQSTQYMRLLNGILKEISRDESIKTQSFQDAQDSISHFSLCCVDSFNHVSMNPHFTEYEKLIYKASYKYVTKVLPDIVSKSTKEFLESRMIDIANVFYSATNHVISNIGKHESKIIAAIDSINHSLEQKCIPKGKSTHFIITRSIILLYFYVQNNFFSEILDTIKRVLEERNKLKSGTDKHNLDINMISAFSYLIKKLNINANTIEMQTQIISDIESYTKNILKNTTVPVNKLPDYLNEAKELILTIYYNTLYNLSNEIFTYTYSKDNTSIIITFYDEYDNAKIKKIMKEMFFSSPSQVNGNLKYTFKHYGLSCDKVNEIIHQLNAITEKSIERSIEKINEKTNDTQSQPINPDAYKLYHIPLDPPPTKNPFYISRSRSPHLESQSKILQVQENIAQHHQDPDTIREQIRGILNLSNDVEIHQLIHPRYPAARAHLCWGIWIPASMEKRSASITDDMLESHHNLLKDQARLEIPAQGACGFKFACFHNLETNKTENTYKTKLTQDSMRVIAVPYQINLPSKEIASVYCFGVIDENHDKKMPRINPSTFLEPYKKKVTRHTIVFG